MKLRFLDSYRIMACSLSELAENLQKSDFIETKNIVSDDDLTLVLRKGVFCYDQAYIDSLKRFDETSLPSIEHFYNKLNVEKLNTENYDHACNVWNSLKMKALEEYSYF